jgi:hypothetical protein
MNFDALRAFSSLALPLHNQLTLQTCSDERVAPAPFPSPRVSAPVQAIHDQSEKRAVHEQDP